MNTSPQIQDIDISPNFKYHEMVRTDRVEFAEENSQGGLSHISDMRRVCIELLEPIRSKFGPVITHSVYRCPNLNISVGSHPTSQHLLAQAADFHIEGREFGQPLREVYLWIARESDIKWHQLIWENTGGPIGKFWIHISVTEGSNDQQIMDYNGTEYVHMEVSELT